MQWKGVNALAETNNVLAALGTTVGSGGMMWVSYQRMWCSI